MPTSSPVKTQKGTVIQRYVPWGFGKPMMDYIYIHHSTTDGWNDMLDLPLIVQEFNPDVIRLTKSAYAIGDRLPDVMLIWCRDFDGEDEPVLTRTQHLQVESENGEWVLTPQSTCEIGQDNPLIYHHKWQFVKPDYDGFDVAEAERRSVAWLSLSGLDMRKIGRYKYWCREVVPRIPEY